MSFCTPLSANRIERSMNETSAEKLRSIISGYLGDVHHRLILIMDQKRDAHTFGLSLALIRELNNEELRLQNHQDFCRQILTSALHIL